MRTVYKYVLDVMDQQVIDMPQGALILSAQIQRGQPCIWASVDTEAPPRPRTIGIFGTGHQMPQIGVKFIGTVQLMDGSLIFHVFEMEP